MEFIESNINGIGDDNNNCDMNFNITKQTNQINNLNEKSQVVILKNNEQNLDNFNKLSLINTTIINKSIVDKSIVDKSNVDKSNVDKSNVKKSISRNTKCIGEKVPNPNDKENGNVDNEDEILKLCVELLGDFNNLNENFIK